MNAMLRGLAPQALRILCALPLATLGSGCLHHVAPVASTTGVQACATRGDESSCVVSSRFDGAGTLRHRVVERTTPGDRCDLVVVEQASFDAAGILLERVVEDRRCRVVDRSSSTRYDLHAGIVEHRVRHDDDHDAEFDSERVVRVPMTKHVRALASRGGAAQTASFEAPASDESAAPAPMLLATTGR